MRDQQVYKVRLPPSKIMDHISETKHLEYTYHYLYSITNQMGPTHTVYKCTECGWSTIIEAEG